MRVWLRGVLIVAFTMILNGLPVLAQEWQELGPNGGDVRAMVADPANPDVLYLGTVDGHIFSSQDAGQHWHLTGRVGDRADTVVMAVIVDRRDSRHLYAATRTLGENGGGVFRSDDGGATWRPSGLAGQAVRALIQTEADKGLFFAGTLDGVYRSRDDGARWERITPANHPDLRNFDSLLSDPRDANVLYAGTYHLAWKTVDGGKNWQNIPTGMVDDSDVMSITNDPANPDRVYASACSGIYHSDNGAAKWSKYAGIPFLSRRTQIIRQDPTNPSIVYAGTTDGLWKTTNAGVSWARVSVPNWTISALLLDSRRPGRIILGVEGLGVYVTRDAGATFSAINEGFSHRQVRELVTDPQQPSRMVLVLTNAVESIYATNDSGRTWTAIGHNASTQTLRHVYAAPEPAGGWWATPQSGGLLHYDAARSTWVQTGVVVARAAAPAARTTKPAANGKTASAAAKSPAAKPAGVGTSAFSKPLRSQVYDLAFSGNLWLAATSDGLIASRDHGATWSEFDSYAKTSSAPRSAVRFVHISPNGQSLWVLGDSGLTISRDGGASWVNADPSLRDAVVKSWMDAEAYTLATYRTACRLAKGGSIGAEASTNKIFWSELDLQMHDAAMRILGARAELMPDAPDAGDVGHWLDGFLFAQAGPIYAGTNEIQRNIIAERMLGLPRS